MKTLKIRNVLIEIDDEKMRIVGGLVNILTSARKIVEIIKFEKPKDVEIIITGASLDKILSHVENATIVTSSKRPIPLAMSILANLRVLRRMISDMSLSDNEKDRIMSIIKSMIDEISGIINIIEG